MILSPFACAALMSFFFFTTLLVVAYFETGRRILGLRLMADGAPLIDVDPPEEFAQFHPRQAISIPLEELAQRAHEFDKTLPVVVYGSAAGRAMSAVNQLRGIGFHQVVNLGPAQTSKW